MFGGKTKIQSGLHWTEYGRLTTNKLRTPFSITFAEVATNNHFVLDRGGKVFKQTAPVIKLKPQATEEQHLQLLGVLNSSTACFWLKMNCHDKGIRGEGGGFTSSEWERFYQFNGSNVERFPIPATYPTALATTLDTLAHELTSISPTALTALSPTLTSIALRNAGDKWKHTRARMIALQEELDWQVYALYNLNAEDLRAPEADVPALALGERAFEIVLARKVEAGEASAEWFERHHSAPITTLPNHWSDAYKAVVEKRIAAMETSRAIGMVERPEYKRRWATDGWDALQKRALRAWLLDRMENRDFWYQEGDQPGLLTRARLTDALSRDDDFVSVAAIYAPDQDLPTVITALLADEHVPFLAALRYKAPTGLKKRADWEHVWDLQRKEDAAPDEPAKRKIRDTIPVPPKYTSADFLKPTYWRARGKLDVPKERFISYGTSTTGTPDLYGWAGWDHREQAHALTTYIYGHDPAAEEMTPLLAGLLELQPWLDQWHGEFDPAYGMSPAAFFTGQRTQIAGGHLLTDDDLRAWRPMAPTRGRRASKK
jgi:hypothetical protein